MTLSLTDAIRSVTNPTAETSAVNKNPENLGESAADYNNLRKTIDKVQQNLDDRLADFKKAKAKAYEDIHTIWGKIQADYKENYIDDKQKQSLTKEVKKLNDFYKKNFN